MRKATRARRAGGGPFLQEKGLVSRDHWSRVRALLYLGGCHDCSTIMNMITTLAFKTWSAALNSRAVGANFHNVLRWLLAFRSNSLSNGDSAGKMKRVVGFENDSARLTKRRSFG